MRLNLYDLRIVLRGLSPLIWHRVLVRCATLAHLHAMRQSLLTWSAEHQHRFPLCT